MNRINRAKLRGILLEPYCKEANPSEALEKLLNKKELHYRGYLTTEQYVEEVNNILSDYIRDYNDGTLNQVKHSEAMKCLENLRKSANTFCQHMPEQCELNKKYADTIKQSLLKAQELEKKLEIIKKKCLYTDNLNEVAACLNYDDYKTRMSKKYDTKVVKTDWNDKTLLDYLKLLTQEEFDLLTRYIKWKKQH